MIFSLTDEQLQGLIDKASSITVAKVQALLSGPNLNVVISKFGTSTLKFLINKYEEKNRLTLISQDIAWLHKKYIADVKTQIADLVKSVGGTVVDV